MKIVFFAIFIAIITVGCSTTTYINFKEGSSHYINKMLDENEKDEILGAEVSIILKGGTRMHGELLYARDSTVIICEKYSATDKELIEQIYPPKIIQNKEIQELTIEGSSYVWLGFIGGGITGGLTGYLVSSEGHSTRGTEGLKVMFSYLVGFWSGALVGGLIGYESSTNDYIFMEIPPDYNFSFLEPLARFSGKEPEYLKRLK